MVNPSSLSLCVFLIPGNLFPLTLFILRFFLFTLAILGIIYQLVYSVSCRVGADMSAVSSDSFPPMCVCFLPGLLTGCYALVLFDT